MYIHDLDLAKAKREAPAYTFYSLLQNNTFGTIAKKKVHNPIL